MQLSFLTTNRGEMPVNSPISPMKEMVAYEALWQNKAATFKSLSELFASNPGKRPSDFVDDKELDKLYKTVKDAVFNISLGSSSPSHDNHYGFSVA